MEYITFFHTDETCYCYSNGKIYTVPNAQFDKTNLKYYLAIGVTTFLLETLKESFENKMTNTLSFLVAVISAILAVTIGIAIYKRTDREWQKKMLASYLSDTQLKRYAQLGQKQFYKKVLILYIFLIVSVFSLILFCFFHDILFWFIGVMSSFCSAITFPSVKPIKLYRFYKKYVDKNDTV